MTRKREPSKTPDVEVDHCWSPGCFWVAPKSAASQEWLAAHTPLKPKWIRSAVSLKRVDWRHGAFMVHNSIAMSILIDQMEADGLRVTVQDIPADVKAWRTKLRKISDEVAAGTAGWSTSEPAPDDTRPRNAFGYLVGFGEAMRRYYERIEEQR